ncbi:MAG: bifunctional DNA-formamidopyrimidine glycosylase/DNA-(apurinic or apyrimidinic site) lyase [Gammaproteobacteria bacterium]|nr:bifunctional DNA-formamidopyrimidine glycosylase/DNA-(apurinic or apyrimidinic site) lyase [Gammaproteobacteria bacterium]
MPELPEVETTLRGIKPHILQEKIKTILVRNHRLRWPIPADIKTLITDQTIEKVERRGKYLLLHTEKGTLILHLGMSGSLRILTEPTPAKKHDHVDIVFSNQVCLRFTDPRRFGALLWTTEDPLNHPLLRSLGPEPLSDDFTGDYLWQRAQKRKAPIKTFIMDSKIVVGVGNIYANEALFEAGIHPKNAAGDVSLIHYNALAKAIKHILRAAIKQGGTTLKDFVNSDGKTGYFRVHLKAYGRASLPCLHCKTTLKEIRLGQRSTVYCPKCQKETKAKTAKRSKKT